MSCEIKRQTLEDTYNLPNSEQAVEFAAKAGLDIVFPTDYELQIDIDSNAALQTFYDILPLVEEYYGVENYNITPSKSGDPERKRIYVTTVKPVLREERFVLQTCLGSDPKREFLGLIQFQNGDPHPTLFYELPKTDVKTESSQPDGESNSIEESIPF